MNSSPRPTPQVLRLVTAIHAVLLLVFLADWMWFGQVRNLLPTFGSLELGQVVYWVVFTSSLPLTLTWVHWAHRVAGDKYLLAVVLSISFIAWWQWLVFAAHGFGLAALAQFFSRSGTAGAFFIGLAWVIWLIDETAYHLEQSRQPVERPDLGRDLSRLLFWGLLFPPLTLIWARRRPRPIRRTALVVLCLATWLWGGFVIYPAYLIASTRQTAAAVNEFLRHLPANANSLASVNLAQLREFEPFQERLQGLRKATEEGDLKPQFEAFSQQLGFNPLDQLERMDYLLLGTLLTENRQARQTIVVLHSTAGFDIATISKECSQTEFLEQTIHTPNREPWLGIALYFPSPQMLVAGREAAVKAAIAQEENHPHRPAFTFINFSRPVVVASSSSYENAPGRIRSLPYLSDSASYANLSDALATGLDAFALSSSLENPLALNFEAECVGLNTARYIEANFSRFKQEMLKLLGALKEEVESKAEEKKAGTSSDAGEPAGTNSPEAKKTEGETANPPDEPKTQAIPELDDDLLDNKKSSKIPGLPALPGDEPAEGNPEPKRKIDLSTLGLLDEQASDPNADDSQEGPLYPGLAEVQSFFESLNIRRSNTEVSISALLSDTDLESFIQSRLPNFSGEQESFFDSEDLLVTLGLIPAPEKPVEETATPEGEEGETGETKQDPKTAETKSPTGEEPVAQAPEKINEPEVVVVQPKPSTAAQIILETRRIGGWYSKILTSRVIPQLLLVTLFAFSVTAIAALLWAGERNLRRSFSPVAAPAGGYSDQRWWHEDVEEGTFLWNPLDVDAWYYGRRSPKLNQSLTTFLSYTFLFALLFFIITNAGGCQEIYEMPAGGGEQAQLQQTVKIQKIIRKKFVVNPFSAISFKIPPIDEVKLQLNEITKHAYTVGYGQGDGAGFAGGTKLGKVRFIRLEYVGGDWDQDFGIGADLNMLLEYGIRTKHKVSDKTESRGIIQLKNFPIGKSPPFVFLTGQKNIVVSKSEVAALREYLLEKHGMLFADNGGSSQFHNQFVAMMRTVLPNVRPVPIPLDDVIHRIPNPIPFLPYVAPHGGKEALGWKVDGRWVCYYHPGDIGDAWSDGHAGVSREIYEACFQLGTNVIFYAHTEYSKWLQARSQNK